VQLFGHIFHKVEDEDEDDEKNLKEQKDAQHPVILQNNHMI
jgi:hypothetical protein